MKKFALRSAKFVLLVAIIVVATEAWYQIRMNFADESTLEELQTWSGLGKDGNNEYLFHRVTLNDIREIALDKNEDGRVDSWIVAIRPDRGFPEECQYTLSDSNFDGILDKLVVGIGNTTGKVVVYKYYSNEDANHESSFTMGLERGEVRYRYTDYDDDGQVDSIWIGSHDSEKGEDMENRGYAIFKRQLAEITDYSMVNGISCSATQIDGAQVKLQFRDGEWREANPSASTE